MQEYDETRNVMPGVSSSLSGPRNPSVMSSIPVKEPSEIERAIIDQHNAIDCLEEKLHFLFEKLAPVLNGTHLQESNEKESESIGKLTVVAEKISINTKKIDKMIRFSGRVTTALEL